MNSSWSIRFHEQWFTVRAMPARAFTATKVFRDSSGATFAINAKGELFCSFVKGRFAFRHLDGKRLRALEGIAALGAMPRDEVKRFAEFSRKVEAAEESARKAEWLAGYAKDAGIDLTAAQQRKIDALKKAARRAK